jgi:MoaA/NifB/PqqE/SkfB family radical SAM enzyme
VELCQEFDDRLFLIFTNGTTLDETDYERLKRSANTAIIVSIEGGSELTNERRGPAVYERALHTLKRLEKIGVLAGVSVTIDRRNLEYWMNTEHIDRLIADGIRLGFFIEYIPSSSTPLPGTSIPPVAQDRPGKAGKHCSNFPTASDEPGEQAAENDHFLMLTPEERERFRAQILKWRREKSIYLIHSPGDEEFFGGCVSAGRGFAHVTPAGDLTPCPVSNVATHNLTDSSLEEGLASPLFREICDNAQLLETGDTPCGLFAHPEEMDALAKAVGAYRTDSDNG